MRKYLAPLGPKIREAREAWHPGWLRARRRAVVIGARSGHWLDDAAHFMCCSNHPVDNPVLKAARGPVVFGMWVLIVVFGFFGLWAAFAPLKSAAVAPGIVTLEASRKTIQHLEGGIVEEIFVHEGDLVQAGQPLIRLNDTSARSTRDMYAGQLHTAQASELRLMAQRAGADTIAFPKEWQSEEAGNEFKDIIATQSQLFDTQRKAVEGKIKVLRQRIAETNKEIDGIKAEVDASDTQIDFLQKEIATVKQLLEKGNASKPRLYGLQRQEAELDGKRGEYIANIAKAEQSITQNELEIINTSNEYQKDGANELHDVQAGIPNYAEKLQAAEDVLKRIVIAAPQSGIVTGINVHTRGGVITPGASLMDIVPQDDRLIIEARVNPRDIDEVHAGLTARVRLTAYKSRRIPIIEGTVMTVSADRLTDKNNNTSNNESYYSVRLVLNEEELKNLKDVKLEPGMPAEVLIVTGNRTFLSYLLTPFSDSMYKAFRER